MEELPEAHGQSTLLHVVSSKAGDCAVNASVQLPINDLLEMQNDLHARIDDGLVALRENQGRRGLPRVPVDMTPTRTVYDANARSEVDAPTLLQAQSQLGNEVDENVQRNALDENAPPPLDNTAAIIDRVLMQDSGSWVSNHYDRGSVFDTKVLATASISSPAQIYSGYTYNRGARGWIKVTLSGGQVQCVELHDFAGHCRALGHPDSGNVIAAATLGLVFNSTMSGGGSASSGDNSDENARETERFMDWKQRSDANFHTYWQ